VRRASQSREIKPSTHDFTNNHASPPFADVLAAPSWFEYVHDATTNEEDGRAPDGGRAVETEKFADPTGSDEKFNSSVIGYSGAVP